MILEKAAVKHQSLVVSPRETKKTTDKSRDKTIRSKQKIARAKRITASSVDKRLWKRSKGSPESSSGQPSQRRIHFVRRDFDAMNKIKKSQKTHLVKFNQQRTTRQIVFSLSSSFFGRYYIRLIFQGFAKHFPFLRNAVIRYESTKWNLILVPFFPITFEGSWK